MKITRPTREDIEEIEMKLARLEKRHPHGAYAPPIYRTSTFCFDSADEAIAAFSGKGEKKYGYGRPDSPSFENLEKILAIWEGGEATCLFSSGMAAIDTTLRTFLRSGDRIICSKPLYSCTDILFSSVYPQWGITADFVDANNPDEIIRALRPETKAAWLETPGNPTVNCIHIYRFCQIINKFNPDIIKISDNTFATPYNQRPLKAGVDIIIHSLTKYLNGHGDVIAGAAIGPACLIEQIRKTLGLTGAILAPDLAVLIERGLETFPERIRKHNSNALRLAKFLRRQPLIEKVYYPGFDPIGQKQMLGLGYGGIISFELREHLGEDKIKKFLNHLVKLGISIAVSLGDTDTLISWPAKMTHAAIPKKERSEKGISENLLRLSVGIEPYEFLESAFKEALECLSK